MDIKTLKEITKLMRENDLMEVDIESEGLKIRLKKAAPAAASQAPIIVHQAPALPAAAIASPVPAHSPTAIDGEPEGMSGFKQVISPIPGTVYLRPNPDSQNFVAVGTTVDETKVVCLVEAMKVFNEIKPDAGVKGTIKKILVQDGQAVEYGTVLFLVG
jgi:acetyl-CoA carboxylase biotin carboxyl carrier protein